MLNDRPLDVPMPRSLRLVTLAGALGGAACVVVLGGDAAALADGVQAWAGALPLAWAAAFVAAGAIAGGGLARSLAPDRRRAAGDGPAWPLVLAVVGVAAILYGTAGGAPLADLLGWLSAWSGRAG